jgi:hypothetical protein
MDMQMKCLYGLTPPIRPIAYLDSHDDSYIFEAEGKYNFWAPYTEDLWLLDDVQTDETALEECALGKKTKLEADDDSYRNLNKLRFQQMELARKNRQNGQT